MNNGTMSEERSNVANPDLITAYTKSLAHVPKMLNIAPNFPKVDNFRKVLSALGT